MKDDESYYDDYDEPAGGDYWDDDEDDEIDELMFGNHASSEECTNCGSVWGTHAGHANMYPDYVENEFNSATNPCDECTSSSKSKSASRLEIVLE